MHQMGNNHTSVVVFRIRLNFWWMMPMGAKNNHKRVSQKVNSGGREQVSQVADLRFQRL